jgi:hypothetical protein
MGFLFHSIVLPDVGRAHEFRLSIQAMNPGAGSLIAQVGVAIWVVLLAGAVWAIRTRYRSTTVGVLVLAAAGQLALTLLFGVETFFYSLYFGPILVLLSALGALTPARRFIVPLAAALAVLAASNHVPKFIDAADQLRRRFQAEQRFTAAVLRLTEPDSLVLCGRPPMAAVGEPAQSLDGVLNEPPSNVVPADDPDACYYRFDASDAERRGWLLPYERWSADAIDAFRHRGAGYFVTTYRRGIEDDPALFQWLDHRFRRLSDDDGMRIYDLRSPRGD